VSRLLDARWLLRIEHLLTVGPVGVWRVGWPSRVDPPVKRGRWWIWVGPYLIGKPDSTW
jgi:hypothetical protein